MNENFYLGSEEYLILFKKGTHYIYNAWEYENASILLPEFVGSYEDCLKVKESMIIGYKESLL